MTPSPSPGRNFSTATENDLTRTQEYDHMAPGRGIAHGRTTDSSSESVGYFNNHDVTVTTVVTVLIMMTQGRMYQLEPDPGPPGGWRCQSLVYFGTP